MGEPRGAFPACGFAARVLDARRGRFREPGADVSAGAGGGSGEARRGEGGRGRYNPLAPKAPMFPAKAKSVIFLFMYGGPSQVDTFDPKPGLVKYDGKTLSADILKGVGEVRTFGGDNRAPLMRSPFKFQKYGKS